MSQSGRTCWPRNTSDNNKTTPTNSSRLQKLRTEHEEPAPGSSAEPQLDRADVVDRFITNEEKVGQVTFFSRRVLHGWRQAAGLNKARRIKNMLQPPAIPDPLPRHSAAPDELPIFAPLTKSS